MPSKIVSTLLEILEVCCPPPEVRGGAVSTLLEILVLHQTAA